MGLESEFLDEMRERLVKSFLDMLVLMKLRKEPMSGYDFVKLIPNRFHLLVSSGTVYSILYYLERKGFIEGSESSGTKRVYNLTLKGEERVKMFLESKDKILGQLLDLFLGQ